MQCAVQHSHADGLSMLTGLSWLSKLCKLAAMVSKTTVPCGKMQQSESCVLQRGLAPRVFEYIFKRISEEEDNVVSIADYADCMQAV